MKKILFIILVIILAPMTAFGEFTDVNKNDYYALAAEELINLEVLSGYPDGTFGAEKTITRAEMTSIICKLLEKTEEADNKKGKTNFNDVVEEHWASGYINVANEEQIVVGYGNGEFGPQNPVKHEEAIKMVLSVFGLDENVEENPNDWSSGYLKIAEKNGITENIRGIKGDASTRGDVAVMVYNGLKNQEISWDFSGNYENYYSSAKPGETVTLSLGVILPKETNWTVDGGEIVRINNKEAKWELPKKTGRYNLKVETNQLGVKKQLEKTISVLDQETIDIFDKLKEEYENEILTGYEVTYNDYDDEDNDGIINIEEKEIGTNFLLFDTDYDGLNDYKEIYEYRTNPLEEDTDKDGVKDGAEIAMGLDPLKEKSNGHDYDRDREFSKKYEEENTGFSIEIEGDAEIVAGLIIEESDIITEKIDGAISPIIEVYTVDNRQDFKSAKLSYNFSDDAVSEYDMDNLSFVYLNREVGTLDVVETVIDKKNKIATAKLDHFSEYILSNLEQMPDTFSTSIETIVAARKELTGYVVADSGFDVTKDAFSFKNFPSVNRDGNCWGISYMVAAIFNNDNNMLKKPANGISPQYDVTSIFNEQVDLYRDFEAEINKSLELQRVFEGTLNYYELAKMDDVIEVWEFKKEIADLFAKNGFNLDYYSDETLNGKQLKVQRAKYDIKDFSPEILKAILWVSTLQELNNLGNFSLGEIERLSLSVINNVNTLYTNLNKKNVMTIGMSPLLNSGHAVTATKIIKSDTSPNMYYIIIYDSNFPGENRYLVAEKSGSAFKLFAPDYSSYIQFDAAYINFNN